MFINRPVEKFSEQIFVGLAFRSIPALAAGYGAGVCLPGSVAKSSGALTVVCTGAPTPAFANLNVLPRVNDSGGKFYAGAENGVYAGGDCTTRAGINGGLP